MGKERERKRKGRERGGEKDRGKRKNILKIVF